MCIVKLSQFLIILVMISGCQTTVPANPVAAHYNTELALAYLNQGDPARAKEKLLLASQQAPKDPVVEDVRGYFLEKTGEVDQARQAYQLAVRLAPHNGAAQNNYGTFLCRQRQYSAAIQHFLLATQDKAYLHPAEAYENAGRCAAEIPNKPLAVQYLQQALSHDPDRTSTLSELHKLGYTGGNIYEGNTYD